MSPDIHVRVGQLLPAIRSTVMEHVKRGGVRVPRWVGDLLPLVGYGPRFDAGGGVRHDNFRRGRRVDVGGRYAEVDTEQRPQRVRPLGVAEHVHAHTFLARKGHVGWPDRHALTHDLVGLRGGDGVLHGRAARAAVVPTIEDHRHGAGQRAGIR